jgi:predicted Rdx family selenoprotein
MNETFILTLTYCDNCSTLLAATRTAQCLTLSKHTFIFFLSPLGPTTGHSFSLAQYILSTHVRRL